MTVREFISRLENLIEHGLNEDAELKAWDPDTEDNEPVTGVVYDSKEVVILTDHPI